MVQSSRPYIRIDLNEFKLYLQLKSRIQLTLHFNSSSRRFYLSLIALVVNEMKKLGKITSMLLREHLDLLILLNESIGDAAGSSDKDHLLHRIYRKWKDALPNLEEAPLFKVLGKKKKEEGDGANGKIYSFTDVVKDEWANLFEYMGSEENVRVKFAIDRIGVGLDETLIIFGDSRNGDAWDQFIASLKKEEKKEEKKKEAAPVEETAVPEPPEVPISAPQKPKISWLSRYRWTVLVIVIGIVAVAIWRVYFIPARIEAASAAKMKYPLPDEPSIVVLPFANMSDDPKDEFLCDGMTEAIITGLSKITKMFVIARTSTFNYKGKPVKIKQVSEELGVRYVLQGSLQRSGDRLRITVQLIDALQGNHLWAQRYDRDLQDLFTLQDEITVKILMAVRVKLTEGGDVSTVGKKADKYFRGKHGLECFLKVVQATVYFRRGNIADTNLARALAEEAIALCPENPVAYASLGWAYQFDYWQGNTESPQQTLEKGIELAQKALAMDESLSKAHSLLCALYGSKGEFAKAIAAGERALALNPGDTPSLINYAYSLISAGRAEEVIPMLGKAIRCSPFGPPGLFHAFGVALRNTGRFEEAVPALKTSIQLAPATLSYHAALIATYVMMDRGKEARSEAEELLRINPNYREKFMAKYPAYKNENKVDTVLRMVVPTVLFTYARKLNYEGRPEEAIPVFEKAIQLHPFNPGFFHEFGVALRNAGRFEEAVSAHGKAIQLNPNNFTFHLAFAITHIMIGNERDARAEAAEVLRVNPGFTMDSWAKTFQYKEQSQQDKIVNAARKAGLK
jgi:adenylate cyclase